MKFRGVVLYLTFLVVFPENASPAAINKEELTSLLKRTTLDDHPGSSPHGQSTNKDTADQGMMRAERFKDTVVWDADSEHPCFKRRTVVVINGTLYIDHECYNTSMIGCSPYPPVSNLCKPLKYYVAGQVLVNGCTCNDN